MTQTHPRVAQVPQLPQDRLEESARMGPWLDALETPTPEPYPEHHDSTVSPRNRPEQVPVPWTAPASPLATRPTMSDKAHQEIPPPSHGGSNHHIRHQPVARKWKTGRKRRTAAVACLNTFLIGFQIGIYAGMVPQIQYQLADDSHFVIQGNV